MNFFGWRVRPTTVQILAIATLLYAFCAGFRTIGDFDFGWQIATGRYLAQHHQIPRIDIFTYTATGREWLYPPLSGLILYWLYLLGGYAALSWVLALAVVVTIAFLLSGPNWGMATSVAAALAVPSIVFRENPRAELFSTVLFAVDLWILWRYFRGARARLWLLPLLMLAWVNLHPGFITGLVLLAGYVLLELCELPFRDRKRLAVQRLRAATPWILASIAATVVNPWGPWIYAGIVRQNRSVRDLGDFIGEWSRPNLSVSVIDQMFRWRNPESSFWALVIFALIALGIAVWRRQTGAAILLAGSTFLSLQFLRFQGLFACIAVIIGGAMLDELVSRSQSAQPAALDSNLLGMRGTRIAGTVALVVLIPLMATRVVDL